MRFDREELEPSSSYYRFALVGRSSKIGDDGQVHVDWVAAAASFVAAPAAWDGIGDCRPRRWAPCPAERSPLARSSVPGSLSGTSAAQFREPLP